MTTINDINDLIRVLQEHPEWRQALRDIILDERLARLPQQMDQPSTRCTRKSSSSKPRWPSGSTRLAAGRPASRTRWTDRGEPSALVPASSPHPPFYFAPHPPVPAPAPERQPQRRTNPRSQKAKPPTPAHAEPNSSQHPRQSRPPLTTSHHRHRPPSPSPPRTESNPARYHPPAHACPPATPGTDPPPAIPP